MSAPLSTRIFITRLISGLSIASPSTVGTNPLASLQGNERNILLTLHLLYPNEFLSALDLLDRRLLTRFCIAKSLVSGGEEEKVVNKNQSAETKQQSVSELENSTDAFKDDTDVEYAGPVHGDIPLSGCEGQSRLSSTSSAPRPSTRIPPAPSKPDQQTVRVYYVRSAQPQKQTRYSHGATIDILPNYEVRLDAWNCSCPAFAFAAFPSATSRPGSAESHQSLQVADASVTTGMLGLQNVDTSFADEAEDTVWIFGGLGLESNLPVCKHLLACVLVERTELFKDCVEDKLVDVEEAAGWAAGWGA
jgi:hypothetical protein